VGKPYVAQPYLAFVILFCVSWYTYGRPVLAVLYGLFWVLNMSRPGHVCKTLDVGYRLSVKSLIRYPTQCRTPLFSVWFRMFRYQAQSDIVHHPRISDWVFTYSFCGLRTQLIVSLLS
jgi:hypothetical protein